LRVVGNSGKADAGEDFIREVGTSRCKIIT